MLRSARDEETRSSREGSPVVVGPLRDLEPLALFALFADVVASGEGYPHAPPLTYEAFEQTWVRPVTAVVGARLSGELVGAYYLKPNSPGRAAHIANAGYVVDSRYRRLGLGRILCEDSIERAPMLGFDAIQFNLVFADNPARALYEELGWVEIGRVPKVLGQTEAIIYWRAV
jgi:GNAT superfamily N-acetyltransferase